MPTHTTIILSDRPSDEEAAAEMAGALLCRQETQNAVLAILFITPPRGSANLVKAMSASLQGIPLIGMTVDSLRTERGVGEVGLVVIASDQIRVTTAVGRELDRWPNRSVGQVFGRIRDQRGQNLRRFLKRSFIVFAHGSTPGGTDIVDRITIEAGLGFELAGAAANEGSSPPSCRLFHGRETLSNSLVGAEILSDVGLGVGVAHGWRLEGPCGQIGESMETALGTIDGMSAALFLGLSEASISQGLGIVMPSGEVHVRTPVRVVRGGAVECFGEIPIGRRVGTAQCDRDSKLKATERALEAARSRLATAAAGGLLFSSHFAGGDNVPLEEEIDLLRRSLDIPWLAVRTWGELARSSAQPTGHLTGTQVVCLIPS